MRALSLDPGKVTGYCYATVVGYQVKIECGEMQMSPGGLDAFLERFIVVDQGNAVVYEDFQFRQGIRTGLDLTPARLIGIIELWDEKSQFVQFYCQQPSVQGDSAFFSNNRLRKLGVYWPHGKGHARSATKHMLYWFKFGAGAQYVKDPVFGLWDR